MKCLNGNDKFGVVYFLPDFPGSIARKYL